MYMAHCLVIYIDVCSKYLNLISDYEIAVVALMIIVIYSLK